MPARVAPAETTVLVDGASLGSSGVPNAERYVCTPTSMPRSDALSTLQIAELFKNGIAEMKTEMVSYIHKLVKGEEGKEKGGIGSSMTTAGDGNTVTLEKAAKMSDGKRATSQSLSFIKTEGKSSH